jgi:type III pantothenate kinase
MILLVDIGNSRVKSASLSAGELSALSMVEHNGLSAEAGWLDTVSGRPDAVYLASVAGAELTESIISASSEKWGITPHILKSTAFCAGVTNGYAKPETLGIDRWAAIIGAYRMVRNSVLVVDCGTACTVDLVDSTGQHLGGAIAPGMQMMHHALRRETAAISADTNAVDAGQWGNSTSGCIQFGVTEAIAAFIDRMVVNAAAMVDGEVALMLTGGDAPLLLQQISGRAIYEKELVFIGMASMVEATEGSSRL